MELDPYEVEYTLKSQIKYANIFSIIVENFTVSGKHRAEWIQIIAFFIFQIGWFGLIILEFFYFTRKH